MEHRHIPASKDGSIPSAKTRFWRGEDNFLEDVWYGRCAICGELIRPPKPWYFIRNVLGYFLTVPYAVIPALIDVPESTALSKALLFTSGFAVLLIIWKLAINACLASASGNYYRMAWRAKNCVSGQIEKVKKCGGSIWP